MLLTGTGAGQTLQTTTVAAQASVSRKDMSVVTAVRNFVRLLGGTFALAIGATIINNALRHSMTSISLPLSTINTIIDNPTLIGTRYSSNSTSNSLASLNLTPSQITHILQGYTSGFRVVFILNACLAGVAVVASITMIRHKELIRGDDEERKAEARREMEFEEKEKGNEREKEKGSDREKRGEGENHEDIEMGVLDTNSS